MIKRQNVAWRWKRKSPDAFASVYMHTVPNGRIYIGVTSRDPELRWQKNGSGYRKQTEFFADIQKYGWDNIKHEILFQSKDDDEAYAKEEEYIREYKAKYGDLVYNTVFGRMHTDQYKKYISLIQKGKTISKESKAKMSATRTAIAGRPVVCWETGDRFPSLKSAAEAYHIPKYGNILTACYRFPEYTIGGYHWYREGDDISQREIPLIKANTLPVRCVETGEVYPSSVEAARAIGFTLPLRIVSICDGAKSKAKSYTWEWATN